MNSELEKKIKALNQDELEAYENASTAADRLVSVLGIGIILLVLNFANILTILAGSIAVYSLSNISVGICNTRQYVRERLESFEKPR